ncbi:SDR family oxidoreductase [Nocardia sp. CDC159]|uniref:SDR family oxidoreductase n=1 Tax=Nocardia pulmonis TaxID=2951408 RepID=A0A9X2E4F7_9NOCA|nr:MULTISPECIES: SDR family oxidoreductase [Nocardia]MCM6773957.1 SDR family oxidoreductase [Nocardia pulmonis]MCM6786844.1 SDR family oxidoreductase [Nocardia sp. CDC159]
MTVSRGQPRRERPVAVVTGGSRGIGARICDRLVAADYEVHFCYRQARRRADATLTRLRRHPGAAAHACQADITDPDQVTAFAAAVGRGVDVIVLNASGGMERDAAPGYAERINGEAQVAVLDAFAPALQPGATVVYLTSLQSHRFGAIEEYDSYLGIARSKYRGERLVAAWCATHAPQAVYTVAVSDMVDGTPAAMLMDLREPAASAERRRAAERSGVPLPTVDAVAAHVVSIALADRAPGAYVDYVAGGAITEAAVRQVGSDRKEYPCTTPFAVPRPEAC